MFMAWWVLAYAQNWATSAIINFRKFLITSQRYPRVILSIYPGKGKKTEDIVGRLVG